MKDIKHMIVQLENLLTQVDAQIDSIQAYAIGEGIRASELRTPKGDWVLPPLLTTKANILHALVLLGED